MFASKGDSSHQAASQPVFFAAAARQSIWLAHRLPCTEQVSCSGHLTLTLLGLDLSRQLLSASIEGKGWSYRARGHDQAIPA